MTQEAQDSLAHGIEVIESYVKVLPETPGVYRMLDRRGDVLYVGKAKALKKRVTSYTQTARLSLRLQRMVAATHAMEFVQTPTETQALLLEASFIKKFKPKYNILLRDDKFFSYLEISKHPYPRLSKHRGPQTDGAVYFGPFASTSAVNASLDSLRRAFRLRSCSDSFFASRNRVCLEYHLKRCHGPCVDKVSQEEYAQAVTQTLAFLKGKDHGLQAELSQHMQEASIAQNYEKAALYRDQIKALTHLQQQQTVHVDALQDVDIFALHQSGGESVVQAFFYRLGRNYGSVSLFPQRMEDEDLGSALESFLALFYTDKRIPKEIYISHPLPEGSTLEAALCEQASRKVHVSCPKRGDKALIVHQAFENAREALARKQAHTRSYQAHLKELSALLGLGDLNRVELYDNSHIQGKYRVGAMVVVSGQGFDKASYRTFKIRAPELEHGGDDYAMMREVLTRRLRVDSTAYNGTMPDLIILDGGAGQVSVVSQVLEELGLSIPLLGIAKGPERNAGREQFYMPGRPVFSLEDRKELLFFLQRARDEVHRFAIGTHRKTRTKNMTVSKLDEIPGVGPTRKRALLQHFGSLKGVMDATPQDLAKLNGISLALARTIYDTLKN